MLRGFLRERERLMCLVAVGAATLTPGSQVRKRSQRSEDTLDVELSWHPSSPENLTKASPETLAITVRRLSARISATEFSGERYGTEDL